MSLAARPFVQLLARNKKAPNQSTVGGLVTAVHATSVDVELNGSTSTITNVPFLSSYTPAVGDTVRVDVRGSDLLVVGAVSGSATTAVTSTPSAGTTPPTTITSGTITGPVTINGLLRVNGAVQVVGSSPLPANAPQMFELYDFGGAPALWFAPGGGGLNVNDTIQTVRGVTTAIPGGNYDDKYGNRFSGSQQGNPTISSILDTGGIGPPGNMLPYVDATFEVFQGLGNPTVGSWTRTSGCDVSAVDATAWGAGAQTVAYDGFYALQANVTTTSTNAVFASAAGTAGVSFLPTWAVATTAFTGLAFLRSNTNTRTATLSINWYNAAGTFLSATTSGAVSIPSGAWTSIQVGVAANGAPATAAFAGIGISYGGGAAVAGEKVFVDGAALFPWTTAQVNSQWSPPIIANIIGNGAGAGDSYRRTGTPFSALQYLYVCTVAGGPSSQVWAGKL